MKFKLLCDRCGGDKKAFRMYTNAYNNGKCHKCNGHGYILTKDEQKAKESHIKYLDTLTRKIKGIEIASEKEVQAVKELKEHEEQHQNKHKELYSKLNESIDKIMEVYKNDPENVKAINEANEEYMKINDKWNATKTDQYVKEFMILIRQKTDTKKIKEKAIKEFEDTQKYYMELMQPVK